MFVLSSYASVRLLLSGQPPVSGQRSPTPLVAAYENHSRKPPAPVTDTFFASRGCLPTRASTVFANLVLKDTTVKFQLDSSATVNILPVEIYQEISKDPELKHLANTATTLVMFNNSELRSLGSVKLEARNPKYNDSHLTEYTVVSKGYKSLLGAQSIQQFNLMSVNVDNIMLVSDEISTCNLSSVLQTTVMSSLEKASWNRNCTSRWINQFHL